MCTLSVYYLGGVPADTKEEEEEGKRVGRVNGTSLSTPTSFLPLEETHSVSMLCLVVIGGCSVIRVIAV